MQLLQEILARRAEAHRRRGLSAHEALERAQSEVLAAARERMGGAEMFCLKACLRGASTTVAARLMPAAS